MQRQSSISGELMAQVILGDTEVINVLKKYVESKYNCVVAEVRNADYNTIGSVVFEIDIEKK